MKVKHYLSTVARVTQQKYLSYLTAMATAYYSQPAAANYYTPASAHHASQKQRGYRICDQCGAAETPATCRFRMCGGCVRVSCLCFVQHFELTSCPLIR